MTIDSIDDDLTDVDDDDDDDVDGDGALDYLANELPAAVDLDRYLVQVVLNNLDNLSGDDSRNLAMRLRVAAITTDPSVTLNSNLLLSSTSTPCDNRSSPI